MSSSVGSQDSYASAGFENIGSDAEFDEDTGEHKAVQENEDELGLLDIEHAGSYGSVDSHAEENEERRAKIKEGTTRRQIENAIARQIRKDTVYKMRIGDDRMGSPYLQQYAMTALIAKRAEQLVEMANKHPGKKNSILSPAELADLPDRDVTTIAESELLHHPENFPLELVRTFEDGYMEIWKVGEMEIDWEMLGI